MQSPWFYQQSSFFSFLFKYKLKNSLSHACYKDLCLPGVEIDEKKTNFSQMTQINTAIGKTSNKNILLIFTSYRKCSSVLLDSSTSADECVRHFGFYCSWTAFQMLSKLECFCFNFFLFGLLLYWQPFLAISQLFLIWFIYIG